MNEKNTSWSRFLEDLAILRGFPCLVYIFLVVLFGFYFSASMNIMRSSIPCIISPHIMSS